MNPYSEPEPEHNVLHYEDQGQYSRGLRAGVRNYAAHAPERFEQERSRAQARAWEAWVVTNRSWPKADAYCGGAVVQLMRDADGRQVDMKTGLPVKVEGGR